MEVQVGVTKFSMMHMRVGKVAICELKKKICVLDCWGTDPNFETCVSREGGFFFHVSRISFQLCSLREFSRPGRRVRASKPGACGKEKKGRIFFSRVSVYARCLIVNRVEQKRPDLTELWKNESHSVMLQDPPTLSALL